MICETVVGKITLSFQLDITIQYLNAYEMHMLDKVRLEFSKLFGKCAKAPSQTHPTSLHPDLYPSS